jgi:hypothetical protein
VFAEGTAAISFTRLYHIKAECSTALCSAGSKGVQKVWLDNKQVFSKTDVNFGGTPIKKLLLQTFHGGSSENFKPDHTQYLWYAHHLDTVAEQLCIWY